VAEIVTQPIYLDISVQPRASITIPLPEGHAGYA